jgi:hypothetical protein
VRLSEGAGREEEGIRRPVRGAAAAEFKRPEAVDHDPLPVFVQVRDRAVQRNGCCGVAVGSVDKALRPLSCLGLRNGASATAGAPIFRLARWAIDN